MYLPEEKIMAFIRRHHVMTLATSDADGMWCANLFYAWIPSLCGFVFTTDADTRHGRQLAANPAVAGSIVLETRIVGRVQGLQFTGRASCPEGPVLAAARAAYLKRFPYAAAAPLTLWLVELETCKLTDNTLGFGKKLTWSRQDCETEGEAARKNEA